MSIVAEFLTNWMTLPPIFYSARLLDDFDQLANARLSNNSSIREVCPCEISKELFNAGFIKDAAEYMSFNWKVRKW